METPYTFELRTALAKGLRELLEKLEDRLSLKDPLQIYLAGGMAVHLYTAARVTGDVDASARSHDWPIMTVKISRTWSGLA
jgi:hypothetical protein